MKTGRNLAATGTLVALLLSAVTVAGPGAFAAGSPEPRPADATAVVRQTVDIDYGARIVVTTVVDTGTGAIDSVRALFRPRGGSTVWSYDYPAFSTADGETSVTFEISTGSGSYYPPGTEFDIEIEVTYTNGEVSAARSPDPVEYLDPARDWKRVAGDGYTVIYYGGSDSKIADLVAETNARIPTLRKVLGVRDTPDFPDFRAIVFPSVRDATPSFPPVSQTATEQLLFAGFAQPQYRLFVQGQVNSTTFVHELAHLYTHEAVSSSLQGGLPSWLGEGLARFLETGSSGSSNARLRSSVSPDDLLSIQRMKTIPGLRRDVFIFYPQAGAFVGYLVEEYGAGSMADFLAAMNGGMSLIAGFEQTYGRSLYEVENDWRASFGAGALPIPTVTPEPVRPAAGTAASTPVPLVDFSASAARNSDPKGGPGASSPEPDANPVQLPTVAFPAPEANSGVAESEVAAGGGQPAVADGGNDPNYALAGLVILLSIIVGVWLFTSRRSKLPKSQS